MVFIPAASLLIPYAFLLVMCNCRLAWSSFDHSDHRTMSTILIIGNGTWPDTFNRRTFTSTIRVTALKAFNLLALDSNVNVTLENRHFDGMESLHVVNITFSGIVYVDRNAFKGLVKLEVVNLNNNLIKQVPESLFRYCSGLKEIYLSGNQIKTLPALVFSENTMLSLLDLSYNDLEVINSTELFAKTKLKHLHLEGNRIHTIYRNTFTELNSLEFLNISYNKMSFSTISICKDEPVLSNYPENHIWLGDMAVKTNSCVIDFSHNNISGLPLSGIHKTCITRCKPLTLLLDGNPLSCGCEGYDLVRYFRKAWSPNVMQAVRISKVPTCSGVESGSVSLFSRVDIGSINCTLNTCPNCPSGCTCWLHKHAATVVVNCTEKQLDTFPADLPITREVRSELWLGQNRISRIDGLKYPYLVQRLGLSHNQIRTLPQNFAKFSNLKVLELHNNDLSVLTSDHVKHMSMLNLARLTLGNNPWNCSDCRILSLVEYLRNSSNEVIDKDQVMCSDRKQLVAEVDPDMCKVFSSTYPLVLMASFLLLTVVSCLLLLWYKVRTGVFVNFWKKAEDREAKLYDAFVSYAQPDEEYVVNLVRSLEARKNPFKICLHSRDWIPGEFIVKQMTDSVNRSHASVIVLSAAYFRSKWCYSEFRIALTQMIVRRNHKVIVIWLSDEDPSLGKLDPDVRLYFSTCTYLKYDDKQFLTKLESALRK